MRGVQVDDDDTPAGTQHPIGLTQTGLATGPEEVRGPGVHHVDGGVDEREGGGRSDQDRETAAASPIHQCPRGLDADHAAGRFRDPRQVEAVTAAHVNDVGAHPLRGLGRGHPSGVPWEPGWLDRQA